MPGTRDALDSLAPWDAIPYFRAVKEGKVTLVASTPTLVVAANPMRVALVISGSGIGTLLVSLDPNTNGTSGISVSNTTPPLVLLFSETGPLCQQAWYSWNMGTPTITFYEIILSKWPRGGAARNGARRAPTS